MSTMKTARGANRRFMPWTRSIRRCAAITASANMRLRRRRCGCLRAACRQTAFWSCIRPAKRSSPFRISRSCGCLACATICVTAATGNSCVRSGQASVWRRSAACVNAGTGCCRCRSRQNTGAFTSGTTCCRANRSTAASCSHRALTRRIRCSSCCFWTRRPSLPKNLANAGTQPCCTAAARRRAGRAMPCSGMQRAAATARLRMKRTAHSMRKTARRASLCRRWPSCRALPGRRSASGSCRCWLRAKTTGSRVRSA